MPGRWAPRVFDCPVPSAVLSKEDGSFRLENMTAGTYTIRVSKELMFFESVTVKIAPNTPQLPDIITAGWVAALSHV